MWPRWRRSTRVFILEVMGRHAVDHGSLGLAAEKEGDAPHVLLFPEITFDEERLFSPESRRR